MPGTSHTCDGFNTWCSARCCSKAMSMATQSYEKIVKGNRPKTTRHRATNGWNYSLFYSSQCTGCNPGEYLREFRYCHWFHGFVRERVYVLDNLLLLTKHVSASMATLVVKTVEYCVLKHHIHSLKSLCISQELHSFSITNCGTIVT